MFHLVITSCLLVGAALAKPSPSNAAPAAVAQGDPELVELGDGPQPEDFQFGDGPQLVDSQVTPLPRYVVSDHLLLVGNHEWHSRNYGASDKYHSYGNYPNNYDSSVRFRGTWGQEISISCDKFNVTSWDAPCNYYDYLSINGVKYCGTSPLNTISSTDLNTKFHSDNVWTGTGFSCIIVVPSVGCKCGVLRQTGRVVGGSNATAGQFPWQAGLIQLNGTRTFCGGSVINNRYVLTAAHCMANRNASQIQVLLGDLNIGTADAGEQRFSVRKIINHPQYTSASGSGWDFSLLKLDRKITFSSTISPVCLPETGQNYAGFTATASGYGQVGATKPMATILQHVQLPVLKQSSCLQKFNILKSNMICAGGYAKGSQAGVKALCRGDSGSPLVTKVSGRFRLIGVASIVNEPCGASNPDVYGRVTEALTWIITNTVDAQYCSA